MGKKKNKKSLMPEHNLAVMDAVEEARNDPENAKWYPEGSLREEEFMKEYWKQHEISQKIEFTEGNPQNLRKEIRLAGTEEDPYDEVVFYKGDVKHREDGPAFISPNSIEYWIDGTLHKDGGPSINYFDGMCLYHLHGVQVPRNVAIAKENEFESEMFTKEENVEVRREVLRKFGTEAIIKHLDAELIDSEDGYELYLVELQKDYKRPCLKMENASIEGIYHMEWVDKNIRTVKDAIRFRNQSALNPKELS